LELLDCVVCKWERKNGRKVDSSQGLNEWAAEVDCHRTTISRHVGHSAIAEEVIEAKTNGSAPPEESGITKDGEVYYSINRNHAVTLKDWEKWVRHGGGDPEDYTPSIRSIAYGVGMYSNRLGMSPKFKGNSSATPKWPVITQPDPVVIPAVVGETREADGRYKVCLKAGDPQIGFRVFEDGTVEPFHDEAAMQVFVSVCRYYQPDKITILGDFLDLASQGRFAQEAAFAKTTNLALVAGYRFLAQLRAACPTAEIILIEGNHDKRMQNFIETNAVSAFGLKRPDLPEEWPVMSIPFLLRLDELDVKYVDAYPAATDWDNDLTRNIHGTRSNSNGSTMAQYMNDLPHINTWAGHTHRAEIVYKTVMGGRGEAIESYAANPGVLCRTDGAVPSVKGAINSSGQSAKIVEDWQAGLGILYYNETESIPNVYRIRNGEALIDGRLFSASTSARMEVL